MKKKVAAALNPISKRSKPQKLVPIKTKVVMVRPEFGDVLIEFEKFKDLGQKCIANGLPIDSVPKLSEAIGTLLHFNHADQTQNVVDFFQALLESKTPPRLWEFGEVFTMLSKGLQETLKKLPEWRGIGKAWTPQNELMFKCATKNDLDINRKTYLELNPPIRVVLENIEEGKIFSPRTSVLAMLQINPKVASYEPAIDDVLLRNKASIQSRSRAEVAKTERELERLLVCVDHATDGEKNKLVDKVLYNAGLSEKCYESLIAFGGIRRMTNRDNPLLCMAMGAKNLPLIRALVKAKVEVLHENISGMNAVHIAASFGFKAGLEALLENLSGTGRQSALNQSSGVGNLSPLHFVAMSKASNDDVGECAVYLRTLGADTTFKVKGWTAHRYARESRKPVTVSQEFLIGQDRDHFNSTAWYSFLYKHPRIALDIPPSLN